MTRSEKVREDRPAPLFAGGVLPAVTCVAHTETVRGQLDLAEVAGVEQRAWVVFPEGDRGCAMDRCVLGTAAPALPDGPLRRSWPLLMALAVSGSHGRKQVAVEQQALQQLRREGLRRTLATDLWEIGPGGSIVTKHWTVEFVGCPMGRNRFPRRPLQRACG